MVSKKKKLSLKKSNKELQVFWAEVYAPDIPDAHNDFMTAEDIRDMAYRFVLDGKLDKIDIEHDNKKYGMHIVESFIAREGDPLFIEGAWVVGIYVPDKDIWKKVKNGEINGLSMEVWSTKVPTETEIDFPVMVIGKTEPDKDDGHQHQYKVYFDENGNFKGGITDVINGHSHKIVSGTITEKAHEHSHRFCMYEEIVEINSNED